MKLPERYREWTYLSSGFNMSYSPNRSGREVFDNVFVNPEAYSGFLRDGVWPDKTALILEVRQAEAKGSINQSGQFQGEATGIEAHVKDEKRFPGKWAFFAFGKNTTGTLIPTSAECYSCHAEHGAVDTTFVQFYPTLLGIAKQKGTLSPSYRKESDPGVTQ